LKQLGWRGPLFIVDDNFIGNKKNVRLLMPDLIDWQKKNEFPFSLLTEASVNLADDDDSVGCNETRRLSTRVSRDRDAGRGESQRSAEVSKSRQPA
jgi:hypothetical protein